MLDHVLDKGIVIVASVGVSVIGLRLIEVDARVVVSSIDTYIARADAIEDAAYARTAPGRRTAATGLPRRGRTCAPRRVSRRRLERVPDMVRCAAGCTLARPNITVDVDGGTVACPYRRGVRCPVDRG